MSETAWVPLPTHDGGWWIRYEGRTKVINVTMEDEGPCCDDDDVLLTERDDVRYLPIPDPPPADAVKLPRRFRWKKGINGELVTGVLFPRQRGANCTSTSMRMVLSDLWYGSDLKNCDAEQWLSDHAAEIEWIDP